MKFKQKSILLLEGVFFPIIVFFGIIILVLSIFQIIFGIEKVETEINSMLLQGLANLVSIICLLPYYISFNKKYEFKHSKFSFKESLNLIPLSFSICIFSNVLINFIPGASENEVSKSVVELVNSYNLILALLIVAVLTPIIEELVFRGFVFDSLNKVFNFPFTVIFTSLLFAFVHGNIHQGIYAIFVGIIFGLVIYKYNNLIYTIFMHFVINLSTLIFVPTISKLSSTSEKLFIAFIAFSIFIIMFYKVFILNKKSGG